MADQDLPTAATTAPEPPQRERTLQLLGAFVHMVRKQDFHWGYLDEAAWPNDDAVLADLNYAARLVGEAIDGNAPRTVREHGLQTVEAQLPERAFERFVRECWHGLTGDARVLAFDAFVEGGCQALEGLANVLELEPASGEQRVLAREIREMIRERVEARRGR